MCFGLWLKLSTNGKLRPITAVIAELMAFGFMGRENLFWLAWPGTEERGTDLAAYRFVVEGLAWSQKSHLNRFYSRTKGTIIISKSGLITWKVCNQWRKFHPHKSKWNSSVRDNELIPCGIKKKNTCESLLLLNLYPFFHSALFSSVSFPTVRFVAVGSSFSVFCPHTREPGQTHSPRDVLPFPQAWALRCM